MEAALERGRASDVALTVGWSIPARGASSRSLDPHHKRRWQEGQVTFLSQQGQETLLVSASSPKTVDLVLRGLQNSTEGGVEAQELVVISSRPGSAEPDSWRRPTLETRKIGR